MHIASAWAVLVRCESRRKRLNSVQCSNPLNVCAYTTAVNICVYTFSPHADLDAFFEAAILALVTMMLIDRAVTTAAARVSQISTDRPLEEALAAFARQHAVVLPGAFISADDAFGRSELLLLVLVVMMM